MEYGHPSEDEWVAPEPTGRSVFIEQAMRLLGVSKRTIYYRIRDGRLRTIRVRGGSQRILIESIRDLVATDKQRASSSRPTADSGPAVSSQTVPCR